MRASLLRGNLLLLVFWCMLSGTVWCGKQCIFVLLSIRSSATYSFILPYTTIHCSVYVDVYVCLCVCVCCLPACLPAYLPVSLSFFLSVCLSSTRGSYDAMKVYMWPQTIFFYKIHVLFLLIMSSCILSVLKHKWELNYSNYIYIYIYSSLHMKWI